MATYANNSRIVRELLDGDTAQISVNNQGAIVQGHAPVQLVVVQFHGQPKVKGWKLSLIRTASGRYELAHITPAGEVAIASPVQTFYIPEGTPLFNRDQHYVEAVLDGIVAVVHAELRHYGTTRVVASSQGGYVPGAVDAGDIS